MKKRIYFIITSIILIIVSMHSIFNANNIITSILESVKEYPDIMTERLTSLFENSGITYIIIISTLCIILNILVIINAIKHKSILKKKGSILACEIIIFFCATNTITEIISVINILILLTSKRINKEDFNEKEKKEIPIIKDDKHSKKEIILAIVLLLAYFSQFGWKHLIPSNATLNTIIIINVIFDIIILTIAITIFYKTLKRDILAFKSNFKTYTSYILPKLGIIYLIYFCLSFIALALASSNTTINQETLESLPLLYTIPAAIIWAPLVEEIIFRGAFKRLIKNEKLFIIISALVFGLLHTISEPSILNMLALSIPYATLGGGFAYIYSKTNNITNNILCHAFHNTIAMIISILIIG